LEHSATNLGRITMIDPPAGRAQAHQRGVIAIAELRVAIGRAELRDVDRGAADLELTALDRAARCIAQAGNGAVFHGWAVAEIAARIWPSATTLMMLTTSTSTSRRPSHSASPHPRRRSLFAHD
jgi:uncharacterized linocin/CFP29 family protein